MKQYGITYDFNSRWSVVEQDDHGRVIAVHEEGLTLDEAQRIVKKLRVDKSEGQAYCNKCGNKVVTSELAEYAYQCLECDEDLFLIETHTKL